MARRRSKLTPKKRAQFLEELAETGNVLLAAELHNLSRRDLYRVRAEDPEFKTAWDEAKNQAADHLEQEARRRALEGWEEPVFYQGERTGLVRKYSDTLLIFLLKGARPEVYRERFEHSGPGGDPLPAAQTIVYLPSNGRDGVPGEVD